MTDERIAVFERHADEYDRWFELHPFAYESELEAVRRLWRRVDLSIEIGCGTGRFMLPLGIPVGVEPARRPAAMARSRGARVLRAVAERLPFADGSFDAALMITTICFLNRPEGSLSEVRRVLKRGGRLIVGFIDRRSFLGRLYMSRRSASAFYRVAQFFSVDEIVELLSTSGFRIDRFVQTIFRHPSELSAPDDVADGYGDGAFVVASARAV